jgi:hypothetical protein
MTARTVSLSTVDLTMPGAVLLSTSGEAKFKLSYKRRSRPSNPATSPGSRDCWIRHGKKPKSLGHARSKLEKANVNH